MPPSTERAYVGLGANLGEAAATLRAALTALAGVPGVSLGPVSPFYASAPIDSSGPDYVNAVAEVDTVLPAHELLAALQAIEAAHGRERPYRNAPRTLDLDLLLYGVSVIETPSLTVPHPRLHQRAFVLTPLADLAPALAVPGLGRDVRSLLGDVAGQRLRRLP